MKAIPRLLLLLHQRHIRAAVAGALQWSTLTSWREGADGEHAPYLPGDVLDVHGGGAAVEETVVHEVSRAACTEQLRHRAPGGVME